MSKKATKAVVPTVLTLDAVKSPSLRASIEELTNEAHKAGAYLFVGLAFLQPEDDNNVYETLNFSTIPPKFREPVDVAFDNAVYAHILNAMAAK